jgi:transposase
MSQNRRKFSLQFKAEAVQFVIQTGRPINEIAKEPEIHEGTLGHWVKQWKGCGWLRWKMRCAGSVGSGTVDPVMIHIGLAEHWRR